MRFFSTCSTIEEVKKVYRAKAPELHPDKGGNVADMQELNKEYAFACAKLASGGSFTAAETEAAILEAEQYRQALEKISAVEGLEVELVGTWIWVTGNTYPHRSKERGGTGLLGEAGFFFASKKQAWYFRSEENKVHNRGRKQDLETIKAKYGSQKIKTGNYRPAYLG